jgi:hypothetical protein
MGHHYAIWASDYNILLAQKKFQALHGRHRQFLFVISQLKTKLL